MSHRDDLERAKRFDHGVAQRCADEARPFRWGTGLFHPGFPDVWDFNFIVLDSPDDDLDVAGLIREAEATHKAAGNPHCHVLIHDAAVGERLSPGMRQAGWTVNRLMFMAHRREPEREPKHPVQEVPESELRAARREFISSQPTGTEDRVVEQLLDTKQVVGRATHRRNYAVSDNGNFVSMCELRSDGKVAQIEDVGTLTTHEGKGYGSAVVLQALADARAEGHELIFLIADEDDWPKEMYGKLGFDPIGFTYNLLRLPPGHPPL